MIVHVNWLVNHSAIDQSETSVIDKKNASMEKFSREMRENLRNFEKLICEFLNSSSISAWQDY